MTQLAGYGRTVGTVGLNGGSTSPGRNYVDKSYPFIAGSFETFVINIRSRAGSVLFKAQVWRQNGTDLDFIGESQVFSSSTTGLNAGLSLTTPIDVLDGDFLGVHIVNDTSDAFEGTDVGGSTIFKSGSNYTTNQPEANFDQSSVYTISMEAHGTETVDPDDITSTTIKQATQRNISTGLFSVTAAGTYAGTPTAIEAQVTYADGGQEVVTAWYDYDASPSGEVFTGSIELTASTRPFQVEFRHKNNTGITATSNSFYGGDFILTFGESLADDMNTDGTGTPSTGVFKASETTGLLSTLSTGQGQIDNANAIVAETGVCAFVMNTGLGGLRLIAENGGTYLYKIGTPTAIYNEALAAYNAAGDVAFVNFIIGANDAYSQLSTTTQYIDGYSGFFAKFRADTRADLKFIASLTGRHTGAIPDADIYNDFLVAQKTAYDADANVFTTLLYDLALVDDVHMTPASYGLLGVRMANTAISNVYSGTADWQPATVSSVQTISTTQTRIVLTHGDGTDFTPVSPTEITGIELTETGDAYTVNVTSALRESATQILVTHDAATVTAGRLYYGPTAVITGVVLDNSTLNLPIVPTTMSASGAPADTTAPVITRLGDATVNVTTGNAYTDAGATASDDTDGNITGSIVTVNPVDVNTPATYTVTYNVSDAAGNAATEVTRTVIVANAVDTTPPVITLTGASTINLNVGDTYTELGATATDDTDGDITNSIVITGTVDTGTAATYTVNYNVDDAAGNSATQVQRSVIVSAVGDTTKPVINLTPNQTSFTITVGDSFTAPTAIATDNVDSDASVTPVDVDTFNNAVAGTYTYTYDHTDTAGNVADTVTVTVIVQTESALVEAIASAEFTVSDSTVTAYSQRKNKQPFKFKLISETTGIDTDASGNFDFDENSVDKVEVYAGAKMIDSTTSAVSWTGSTLYAELGALEMPTSQKSLAIVVYVDPDTKGIVFAGPGMAANIYCSFQALS